MKRFANFPIRRSLALGCLLLAAVGAPALAQQYPVKPIHVIVPLGAGSSTDMIARLLATGLTEETGQPVLVENRPGAEGAIGSRAVAAAPADGYTLMITSSSTQVLSTHLYRNLSFHPLRDFEAVTPLLSIPFVLYVPTGSPFKSVGDVIAAARKEPGKLTFGSGTSSARLTGEMFAQAAGLQLTHVPYKTTAASITDLAGGRIDLVFTDAATASAHLSRIRPLVIMLDKRHEQMPQIPSIAEAGVTGYRLTAFFGVWAPAGTPAPLLARINGLFANAMKTQRMRDLTAKIGGQPFHLGPEEFKKHVASEYERMGAVIKAAKIEMQ